ncbi:MAG: N(4)-(beta-N-acetylglucosaminyl)-L-asparaginase [Candidatus Latescibacterota bacterium]
MDMDRRQFLRLSAVAAAAMGLEVDGRPAWGQEAGTQGGVRPLAVATWDFGQPATARAVEVLESGGGVLDAVEAGVRLVESTAPEPSVGPGGKPNAEGVVQLDACIMGPDRRAGSVAALEGFVHPISVARRVMEVTPHVMLVGAGAGQFARAQGMEQAEMPTPERRQEWERWKERRRAAAPDSAHDTLTLLVVDAQGRVAGGCSTSGWAYKLPGRVGDSPIIGSGLYVDGEVGAAGGTGQGEDIMRYCSAFLIVELMRQGMGPQQACQAAILRLGTGEAWKEDLQASFVAVDVEGRWGAATTSERFLCAVTGGGSSRLERPVMVRGVGG